MLVIKEAFRTINRTLGTWIMSVLTVAVALGVAGLFLLLSWKAHSEMRTLRANLSVQAFFDPTLSSEEASAISEREVKSLAGLASIKFISKEQALDDYATSSGENVENILGVNPLPASVSVYLQEPSAATAKTIMEKLRAIEGITEVQSDLPLLSTMEQRAHALDWVALMLGALLVISAIFYTVTSGRLTIASRADTLHAMKLMGATRGLLIGPFVIESALAGLFGGLLAAGLVLLIQQEAFSVIGGEMSLHTSTGLSTRLLAGGAITGMLLGGSASVAAYLLKRL